MRSRFSRFIVFALCAVLLFQLSSVSFAEVEAPTGLAWEAYYAYGFRVYKDAECTELIEYTSDFMDVPVGETLYYKKICEDGWWMVDIYIPDTPSFTENSFVLTQEHKDTGYIQFEYLEVFAGDFYRRDYSVNIKDAMWMMRYLAGWDIPRDKSNNYNIVSPFEGDYNRDGKIDVKDVSAILKQIADPEAPLPYGGYAEDFVLIPSLEESYELHHKYRYGDCGDFDDLLSAYTNN